MEKCLYTEFVTHYNIKSTGSFVHIRVLKNSFIASSLHIIQTVTLLGSTMRSPFDDVAFTACLSSVWNVFASVVPDFTAARNVVMTLPGLNE